ncbi:hypothetical protein [Mycetocola saprophilus]|uniref:hypothetical protein n=1 Tax=Mycetocola saprophilus TaxID=76636 RepID=UPI0004C12879|nr:hypothetical protein [Mycetocola saprophilus]
MQRVWSSARILSFAALSVVGVIGLAGCGTVNTLIAEPKSAIYPTYKEFAPEAAKLAPTPFIPEDSTNIRIKSHPSTPGTLITFHTDSPLPEGACKAGERPESPGLNDTWWPTEVPKEVQICGDWSIFTAGGNYYGETLVSPK